MRSEGVAQSGKSVCNAAGLFISAWLISLKLLYSHAQRFFKMVSFQEHGV